MLYYNKHIDKLPDSILSDKDHTALPPRVTEIITNDTHQP